MRSEHNKFFCIFTAEIAESAEIFLGFLCELSGLRG
jgi:hypothetical protein